MTEGPARVLNNAAARRCRCWVCNGNIPPQSEPQRLLSKVDIRACERPFAWLRPSAIFPNAWLALGHPRLALLLRAPPRHRAKRLPEVHRLRSIEASVVGCGGTVLATHRGIRC